MGWLCSHNLSTSKYRAPGWPVIPRVELQVVSLSLWADSRGDCAVMMRLWCQWAAGHARCTHTTHTHTGAAAVGEHGSQQAWLAVLITCQHWCSSNDGLAAVSASGSLRPNCHRPVMDALPPTTDWPPQLGKALYHRPLVTKTSYREWTHKRRTLHWHCTHILIIASKSLLFYMYFNSFPISCRETKMG